MTAHVAALWIYPIKSCRGIAVESITLDDRGPENDRRWMLVDAQGRFLSQRILARMSLIDVALVTGGVSVGARGMPDLFVSASASDGQRACAIWHDTVDLLHVGAEADEWFSTFLRIDCSLMRMPRESERAIHRDYSPEPRLVSLADGFPMLLIGTGSLTLLNEKLAARGEPKITMLRFRPNVVVSGTQPHEEDEWRGIRIGDVACTVVKPCARCVTTTIDLETGEPGIEPLQTLATYRKQGSKVLFGQNVIHRKPGTIRLGDLVVQA